MRQNKTLPAEWMAFFSSGTEVEGEKEGAACAAKDPRRVERRPQQAAQQPREAGEGNPKVTNGRAKDPKRQPQGTQTPNRGRQVVLFSVQFGMLEELRYVLDLSVYKSLRLQMPTATRKHEAPVRAAKT